MFFCLKKSASGETLQLLESYRNGDGKPRTRVVASLGGVEYDLELRSAVAVEVEARLYDRALLFEPSREVAEIADRIVRLVLDRGRWTPMHTQKGNVPGDSEQVDKVRGEQQGNIINGVLLDRVETENSVSLGPELVGLHAWQALEMDKCLERLGFNPAQQRAACSQVVGRLADPGSERALSSSVLPGSALPELLGEVGSPTPTSCDRLYRASDKLIENRQAIEAHCRKIIGDQLSLTRTYYLYDLTNSHFEGTCAANPKAKRGNSKQKRNDCPLITAGVCFDEHGFVLFHKTFSGNVGEASTLPEMIELMRKSVDPESLFETSPTILLDGGLATPANLKVMRGAGMSYIVNRTRSHRKAFESLFAQPETFKNVPGRADAKAVRVRTVELPDDDDNAGDIAVLCYSSARGDKEAAIRSKAEDKLLADLEKLKLRIKSGRLKNEEKIQQAIGRLRERHPSVARYYIVEFKDQSLDWSRIDASAESAASLDGCYVLQTCLNGLSASELWQRYVVLTKAEDGFRCIKHTCGMRPNYHQLEHRVDGHVFISVLAYQLTRFICYQLEAQGDMRTWTTLRRILQAHRYCTIVLPTVDGDVWRIRKAGKPEASHRYIYSALGIDYLALPSTKTHSEADQKTNRKV